MEINRILPLGKIEPEQPAESGKAGGFGEILKNALEKVNQMQIAADQATMELAMGEDIDLHKVMILTTRANLALEATIAVRNKVLDAYQEIMRMQV
jgi:flagellar hook-basal body complex protein FliE